MYEKFGCINYDLLVRDKLITVKRDEDGKIIPKTQFKYQHELDYKEFSIGQLKEDGNKMILDGIGRKIRIWTKYGGGIVQEGQFTDGELNGFGRWTICQYDDTHDCYIGWWKEGQRHGYGRKVDYDNEVINGWFENADQHFGDPVKEKAEIKSYDVENDRIAKMIDFDKYG